MVNQTIQLQQVNANSLRSRAKQHHLQNYLTEHNPHVMMIYETHLSESYNPQFNNYIMHRSDRVNNWADDNNQHFHVIFPTEPTFMTVGRTPSFLDYYIVSTNTLDLDQLDLNTLDFLSDHRAIRLNLILQDKIQLIERQTIWNWSKCNWNEFNVYVENELCNLNIPVNHNIDKDQIDDYVGKIEDIFDSALNRCCPKVKLNRSKLISLSERSNALIKQKTNLRRRLYSNRNSANYFVIERSIKK